MDERAQRIVDTAIELAERDGFAAVRLRDVASQAQVALGTVYRRFSSKEDILVAALEQEAVRLQSTVANLDMTNPHPDVRLIAFFESMTEGLCSRPNLARALIRSVSTAEKGLGDKISQFREIVDGLIIAGIRGDVQAPSDDDRRLATLLQNQWFAAMVGWSIDLHPFQTVIEQMRAAVPILLRGAGREVST
jgi:AcrR family transcriptional regulator